MTTLQHRFVKFIPRDLEEGVIYVSKEYSTASHRCCCGCGKEVVTPLSQTDWQVSVDRGRVSIYPSIGNWNFPCRSHYWIRNATVIWAEEWSQEEIDAGRYFDSISKERFYKSEATDHADGTSSDTEKTAPEPPDIPTSLWLKLRNWLS